MEHVFENNLLWDENNSHVRKIWERQRNLVLIMADFPKILHELNGIPLIVHVVKSALQIDVTSVIYIIVGEYRDQIENVINEHFFKSDYIRYINQPEIHCCLKEYFPCSRVLILPGDVAFFSTHSMRELMNIRSKATIVCTKMEEPHGYGRIIQSPIQIVEEKDCSDEEKLVKLVNCGIYVFENEFLYKNLPKITNNMTSIFSGREEVNIFEIPVEKQYEVYRPNNC